MCKQLACFSDLATIRGRFRVRARAGKDIVPAWNISMGGRAPVVHRGARGWWEIAYMIWGMPLEHPRLSETGGLVSCIEAETLRRAALLESLFETQRCIVPADAFYLGPPSWARQGRVWTFALDDLSQMGLAALWLPNAEGEPGGAFAIVTTSPNESAALLDDSMPAILFPRDEAKWINPDTDPYDAYCLIKPFPAELMRASPVAAGWPGSDNPALLHRVT